MQKNLYIKGLLFTITALTALPMCARHGSNIMAGTIMGAGLGGIFGGSDGVVPGMVTGMAVGTIAEIADRDHCHPRHCHEVVYTHEVRPSRYSLEHEIDRLETKLSESNKYAHHLERTIEQKDYEISRLEARIRNLEHEINSINGVHKTIKTGFVIEAKAVAS